MTAKDRIRLCPGRPSGNRCLGPSGTRPRNHQDHNKCFESPIILIRGLESPPAYRQWKKSQICPSQGRGGMVCPPRAW